MRPGPQASYRLADYLEQFGKQTRSLGCPQDKFWLAALRDEVADRDRTALACAAYARGRTVIAYRLADAAMTGGNASGIASFAYGIQEKEGREASLPYFRFAAEHGDTWSQVRMGWWHEETGGTKKKENGIPLKPGTAARTTGRMPPPSSGEQPSKPAWVTVTRQSRSTNVR